MHAPKMRVLVVEDEALVSMLIEDELGAGYDIAGPFLTCGTALDWLEQDTPDMAVLD